MPSNWPSLVLRRMFVFVAIVCVLFATCDQSGPREIQVTHHEG